MTFKTVFLHHSGLGDVVHKTVGLFSNALNRPLSVKYVDDPGFGYKQLSTDFSSIFVDGSHLAEDIDAVTSNQLLDRLDHVLAHLVFRTDVIIISKLCSIVAKKLKHSKTLSINASDELISTAIKTLMLSYEDSRVLYQWGLRYPGSAERRREKMLSAVMADSCSDTLIDIYNEYDLNYVTGSMLGTTRRFRKQISEWIKAGTIEQELKKIAASKIMNAVHSDLEYPDYMYVNSSDLADSRLTESVAFNDNIDKTFEETYQESVKQALDVISGKSTVEGNTPDVIGYKTVVVDNADSEKNLPEPRHDLVAIFRAIKRRKRRIYEDSGNSIDIVRTIGVVSGTSSEPPFNSESRMSGLALTILLDKSKSMVGLPFQIAFEASLEVCSAAKEAGIDVNVFGFTSKNNGELFLENYGSGVNPDLSFFGSTLLHAAVDYVSRSIQKSARIKNALLIISDGSPNFTNIYGEDVYKEIVVMELRDSIRRLVGSGIAVHAAIIPTENDAVAEKETLKQFEGVCSTSVIKKQTAKSDLKTMAINLVNII